MLSYPTGNEFVALSRLSASDGGLYAANLLSRTHKGILEFACNQERSEPFLLPVVYYHGTRTSFAPLEWSQEHYWLPVASGRSPGLLVKMRWVAPLGLKGFAIVLEFSSPDGDPVDASEIVCALEGGWGPVEKHVNSCSVLPGERRVRKACWDNGLVFEFAQQQMVASFCLSCSNKDFVALHADTRKVRQTDPNPARLPRLSKEVCVAGNEQVRFCLAANATQCKSEARVAFFVGFGQDELSSVSAAAHLDRMGAEEILATARLQLEKITLEEAPDESVRRAINRNAMYCNFFSTGRTYDTEELTCITSRDTSYQLSGAYFDRGALFWTFPCVLQQDRKKARELLEYAFTVQLRNTGMRSRFLDGTVMESGIELDQLCSPVIELVHYLRFSNDYDFPREKFVQEAIAGLRERVMALKLRNTFLFRTFLNSSDTVPPYPCVTFLNVLAWRFFFDLAFLDEKLNAISRSTENRNSALRLRRAIYTHCIRRVAGHDVFAYSVPLEGDEIHHDPLLPDAEIQEEIAQGLYDDPLGSLLTLPYWGFCKHFDPVYENTVRLLLSKEHAYYHKGQPFDFCGSHSGRKAAGPNIASIANQLLVRMNQQKIHDLIPALKMDNGLACETIDAETGEVETGRGMANMAGFLAYAMYRGLAKVSGYGLPEPTADEIAKTEGAIRQAALRAGLPYPRPHYGSGSDESYPPLRQQFTQPTQKPASAHGLSSSSSHPRSESSFPRSRYGRPEVDIPDNIPDDIGNRLPGSKRPTRPPSPYTLTEEESDLSDLGD